MRLLVNWWAYTWGGGLILGGGAYIRRFTVCADFSQGSTKKIRQNLGKQCVVMK